MPKRYLCEHQEQAMYVLKDNPTARVFFDSDFRLDYLQKKVVDYGLENETNLDDYFKLKLEYNTIIIQPIIKGLVSMGESGKLKIATALKLSNHAPMEFSASEQLTGQSFIVFGQNNYSDDFYVNIMSSGLTKDGKIKIKKI